MASGSPASNWRKGRALAALAVLAVAALAWRWGSARDAPPTNRQTAAQSSAAVVAKPALGPVAHPQPAVAGCPIPLGRDLHYLAQAGVVLDNPQQPALTASWAYSVRALQRHADGTTVLAARIRRTDEPAAGSQPWPDVSPAFLLRLGADCAHLAYAWQRDADLEGARSQQGRAAMFAFVLPARAHTATTGEAVDDNGRYLYAALRTEGAAGPVVRLQNRGYRTAVASQAQGLPAAVAVEGPGLTVQLDSTRWLSSAELSQTVRVATQPGLTATVQAKLTAAQTGLDLSAVDAQAPGWVWGNLLLDSAAQHRARLRPDPQLVGMAPAELFAQLQAADPSAERIAQGLRYLEAWLLANPAGADQLRDWLRTQSERYTNNPWARMALAALGRCGLPQARAAQRSLAQDPKLASAMRLHALLNLATAEGLEPGDGEFLREQARERVAHGLDSQAVQDSASALTALGMVARHPNLQGTPIQAAAIDDLRAALRTETDETYLQAAVNGAGNAADPALLAELEPLSHHANSDIRRRVADALRGMPAEAIEAWFAPWLAREEAPAVAAQLIAAYPLHYGPGAAVPAAVLQPALVAQFAAESARGAAAEAAVLQAIGAYVGAAELAGAK